MDQYATFLVLVMSTHFYIIPSTYANTTSLPIPTVDNTTVILTSPKPPTTTTTVPTTTSSTASLTNSTIVKTPPTAKPFPTTSEESDVKTQGADLSTTEQSPIDGLDGPGGVASGLLQLQNLDTANVTETVTSPTNVTHSDTTNSSTSTDKAESTEDAHTSYATFPSTIKFTFSPNTESNTSGIDQNATTDSHVTSEMSSSSTGSETTPEMTTTSSGTDKASTGVTKASGGKTASMFGTTGLPVIIGLLVICLFLLIIIIILIIRATKSRRHKPQHGDDKSVPKLQLLEIRDEKAKRNNHDDLQTFSLDYEKHVQEKIEEHKRKSQPPPKAEKPGVGVSTFMQKKKQSLRSNQSVSSYGSSSSPLSPVSPSSPSSPAEHKPLIQQPDDEPFVFNFAKRPSELLTARRTSALDDAGRRRSNASGQKTPKLALPENELFDI